ncbi:MAG: hypothetical protein NUW37_00965 [Planctomycetes bacterium]|nr:hypothetical protein [Planctomycetota bacterium]
MKFFFECNNDEAVLKALGVSRKQRKHIERKGQVIRRVAKEEGSVVGMVDSDPEGGNPPRDLSRFTETKNQYGLTIKRRGAENKFIIEIRPRLEDWLIERANTARIDLKKSKLPETGDKLHKLPNISKTEKFKQFLETLLEKDAGMQFLKTWIDEQTKG